MTKPPMKIMTAASQAPSELERRGVKHQIPVVISMREETRKIPDHASSNSKWGRFVDEIMNDPDYKKLEVQAAWEQVQNDARTVREEFTFKHDL